MRAVRRAQSTSVMPSRQAAALLYRLLMAVVATAALLIVWRPRVVHAQSAQSTDAQASDSAAAQAASQAQAQPARQPSTTTPVVKPGETRWSLAARYYGDGHQWQELARRNGIATTDGAPLRVGQRLTVPARRVASGSKAAATAAAPADSTVPRVALTKAGEGTLPTPPAAARSTPAGRGSLAAQTASKGNAAAGAAQAAAAPKPAQPTAQPSAQAQAQADTSRANLTPQVGTMLGERSLKRIGLVDQSTQAASRKPAEGQTIFHLDMPDAAEAERRTQAALRPNVPVLRQAEFDAAPYLASESAVKGAGRIVARRGASAEGDQAYPQRALKTDEVEVQPPAGTTWSVGDRLVAFTTQTLTGGNKGRLVVLPTGLLEVRRADGGAVAIAEVLRQSGRVEQGQQLVAASGAAAPRVQAQKLATPDVATSVLWLDPNELLPTLSSYVVLGAGADKGLKAGDEVALYAAVAGAREAVMATVRVVRVDATSSTAVIVSQQGRDIAVGMTARRFAKAPE
ncbi:MAG: LysM peptidoglycan-binding domain-containing protein [Gemmatimonadaceae bacterium]|nr:LysM peptidoglycan-binding domain-containing protein [Gemmatimonadaceae bacterium]